MSSRFAKLLAATAAAAVMAVVTVATQYGSFQEQHEGELFGERNLFETPGYPAGVTYIGDTLYIVDSENNTLVVYDGDNETPQTIDLATAAPDLTPNQIAVASVDVVSASGTDTKKVLLVSDSNVDRVLAFEPDGTLLFSMLLEWPDANYGETSVPVINGMSLSPQATFRLTRGQNSDTLEVVGGAFAAGWAVDFGQGVPGALLVYKDDAVDYTAFEYDTAADQFVGTPYRSLTDGGRTNEAFGVAFDAAGNLYLVDSFRYTITAYGADFHPTPLFTFGTPTVGGKTEEFYEPYGVAYWPDPSDPAGGRLFIADAINNRIVAYRPDLPGATLVPIFAIDLPGLSEGGLAPGQPYGVAVEPATGKVSTSDASGEANRVWVLQTRNLVAFNLQVLDAGGTPVEAVCSGARYSVQFSLTVPKGRPPVSGATPVLEVGQATINSANDGPVDLAALQTFTYTYALTAPGTKRNPVVASLPILASATADTVTDVLPREGTVVVADCSGPAPVITATPSVEPQLSGLTTVFPATLDPVTYAMEVSLVASPAPGDTTGIKQVEYQRFGAYQDDGDLHVLSNAGEPVGVEVTELGLTRIRYRARNERNVSSDWQELILNLVTVINRTNTEGDIVDPFILPGAPGYTYLVEGLPDGVVVDPNDPTGRRIIGTLSYTSSGSHTVTVTESTSSGSSSWTFTWAVANTNGPPVANPDASYTTNEDTTLTPVVGVLANDTDPDLTQLSAVLVSPPSSGELTFNADGSFTYVPAPNVHGIVQFTYQADDGVLKSAVTQVTVTVAAVNDAPSFTIGAPPTATEDAALQTLTNWATGISRGPDNESGQTVTFLVSNSNPALFAVQPAIAPDGTLTYQPASNAFGTATVTVRIKDDGGIANGGVDTSAPQTFVITVNEVNDAPVAAPNSYSVVEATTLSVQAPGVLAGDTDVDSSVLTAVLVAGPSNGALTLNADGSFSYTPTTGFTGGDSFTYLASDGSAQSAAVTVSIAVNPRNQPPVCTAVVVSPSILWPPNHKPVYLTLSGITDPDGDQLTVLFTSILQDEPTNGPGQGNTMQDGGIEPGGTRAWVRPERTGGGDGRVYVISYTASDGVASCSGQVTVSVPHDQSGAPAELSPGSWNSLDGKLVLPPPAPLAVDDAATVATRKSVTIAVLSNDVANGSPLTVTLVSKPAKGIGTATVNADGTITYKASKSTGTASFIYRITDIYGGTATATVTITVTS